MSVRRYLRTDPPSPSLSPEFTSCNKINLVRPLFSLSLVSAPEIVHFLFALFISIVKDRHVAWGLAKNSFVLILTLYSNYKIFVLN